MGCSEMQNSMTISNEKERIRMRIRKGLAVIPQSSLALDLPSGDIYVRVAVYIRTHHCSLAENAYHSLDLQKRHYEELLYSLPGYRLVQVYHDAPHASGRSAFQRMMNDCKSGKIDLIITKSMSRFAPTLKECMDTVQKLRALQHPVGVFFETENIFTLRNTALFTEERITGLDDSMTWREPNEES